MKMIRDLFRRVRSYILRKWFKVPVAAEKVVAGQPVYVDKDFKLTAAQAAQPPRRGLGLSLQSADKGESVQVVVSGAITFTRPELLGYAAVDIYEGMSLVVEHVDEDERVWLRPLAMEFPDDTPMAVIKATLDAGSYGTAIADAAAGEPVMGYKS